MKNSDGSFKSGLAEVFKDTDSQFSAKRAGFFIFTLLIVICTLASVFAHVYIVPSIFAGLVDLVKWIGAAILGERAPAALAAMRGTPAPAVTSTSTVTSTSSTTPVTAPAAPIIPVTVEPLPPVVMPAPAPVVPTPAPAPPCSAPPSTPCIAPQPVTLAPATIVGAVLTPKLTAMG